MRFVAWTVNGLDGGFLQKTPSDVAWGHCFTFFRGGVVFLQYPLKGLLEVIIGCSGYRA